MKNKILCVLQVRGGSKGVPKKNIREVNGKPLMTWTIESAKKSNVFDSIWVSSDSDEILEVGPGAGALTHSILNKKPKLAAPIEYLR